MLLQFRFYFGRRDRAIKFACRIQNTNFLRRRQSSVWKWRDFILLLVSLTYAHYTSIDDDCVNSVEGGISLYISQKSAVRSLAPSTACKSY